MMIDLMIFIIPITPTKLKKQTNNKTKTWPYEKTHWVGRGEGSEAGNSKESKGGLTMLKWSYNNVRNDDLVIFIFLKKKTTVRTFILTLTDTFEVDRD